MVSSSLPIANQRPSWKQWGWIALANTAIVAVGTMIWFLALVLLSRIAEQMHSSRSGELVNLFAVLVLPNVVAGTAVGFAQWVWLWREEAPLGAWVLVSVIGWTIDFAVPLLMPITSDDPLRDTLYIAGSRTSIGAIIGIWQWLLIRKHVRSSGWWIPISAGATAVAWIGFLAYV